MLSKELTCLRTAVSWSTEYRLILMRLGSIMNKIVYIFDLKWIVCDKLWTVEQYSRVMLQNSGTRNNYIFSYFRRSASISKNLSWITVNPELWRKLLGYEKTWGILGKSRKLTKFFDSYWKLFKILKLELIFFNLINSNQFD